MATEKRSIPIMRPFFDEAEAQAVAQTLASGWVAQGPRTTEFEQAVAAYTGNTFAIATTNCTTALHLCMLGMGFGPGMDVLVPSFTFVATPNSVEYTGARAVLTEVSQGTYNIDLAWTEAYVSEHYQPSDDSWIHRGTGNRLAGIVPVNLFGLCADLPAVNDFAKKYNLRVVEDSACALGAKIGEVHQGGFGNPSTLSFHPRKSITTGEGGMILTNNAVFADHVRRLRSHAASVSEVQRHRSAGYLLPDYDEIGFNYRMTDIQAAVGLAQVQKLELITSERIRLAARYDRLIQEQVPFLKTPQVPAGYTHIYQTYACMIDLEALGLETVEEGNRFRNRLMAELDKVGIATRQGTHATHLLGYYREKYGYQPDDLPGAKACDRLSLALPLYVQFSEPDQDFVVSQLAELGEICRP